MSWPVSRKLNGQESWENKMVKPIVKDVFFLGQKSEPATKADLQMGEASKVVPIDKLSVVITLVLAFVFLHEEFTPKSLIGCVLIGAGTLIMVL